MGELNSRPRIDNPVRYHYVNRPILERVKGIEPSTASLATKYSTSELHPRYFIKYLIDQEPENKLTIRRHLANLPEHAAIVQYTVVL